MRRRRVSPGWNLSARLPKSSKPSDLLIQHIYGGDFFAAERSEWDSLTLEEHLSDGERTRRVFEEANARFEVSKRLRA